MQSKSELDAVAVQITAGFQGDLDQETVRKVIERHHLAHPTCRVLAKTQDGTRSGDRVEVAMSGGPNRTGRLFAVLTQSALSGRSQTVVEQWLVMLDDPNIIRISGENARRIQAA